MGNQVCGFERQFLALSVVERTQVSAELPSEHRIKTKGAESSMCDYEEIDECSPFSKYDIKFLNTSVKASDIGGFGDEGDDYDKKIRAKPLNSIFNVKRKFDTRRSLLEWQKTGFLNFCNSHSNAQNRINETDKIKALKALSNFLEQNQKETKFQVLKISGDSFCKLRNQPIAPYYELNRKIGQGSFGSVYIGKCLKSGQPRAIKVLKKKSMNDEDQKTLLSEINILKKMDHINIIKLYDVFYYKNFFYVITEFCQGGSLLKALQANKIKSQKNAATIMRQLISAVSYMHEMKIAHRDLKLDNIVLVRKIDDKENGTQSSEHKNGTDNLVIKIIDFGLAQKVAFTYRNKSKMVGTVDYMAPEIFLGYFSCYSDVWSCGIIMCILLIGLNPLKKKTIQQTINAIKQQQINFKKPQWGKISSKAKSLLALMLNKKQQKRISSEQVMKNQWLQQVMTKQKNMAKSEIVINNFNTFQRGNNFICFIKNFLISRELTQDQRQQMALIFQKIDCDSSGVIQKHQLIQLYSLVTGATDEQITKLIDKIDQNKSGRIDFQQFLICMSQNQILQNHQYLNQAFEFLDQDRTGFIQRGQLVDCLEGCEEGELVKILKDLDFNGDGKVSREEFIQYMMEVKI